LNLVLAVLKVLSMSLASPLGPCVLPHLVYLHFVFSPNFKNMSVLISLFAATECKRPCYRDEGFARLVYCFADPYAYFKEYVDAIDECPEQVSSNEERGVVP
jgi:hypothetical protein